MKTKSFWLALVSAIIVLLQALGIKVDAPAVNEIITALCSVAIVMGIVIDDTKTKQTEESEEKEQE